MNGLHVMGRMLKEPRVSVTAEEDRVRIRVDCAFNDEYWTELSITAAALCELLAQVAAQKGGMRSGLLAACETLADSFAK